MPIVSNAALAVNNSNFLVRATVTVPNPTAGENDTTLTLQLSDLDGNAITSAREVMIVARAGQYGSPLAPLVATVTFPGNILSGTIVNSGAGYCLARTLATGAFTVDVEDSADETVWFQVLTAPSISAAGRGCIVAECVADSAVWAPA